jgi:pimeloyl-ACP methyl ester carboxylesterase
VPEDVSTDGVRLHVEADGSGEPVTVFAHGLTNSCMELSAFTPLAPGTKVRFCFRGHGHSEVAPAGSYRFADYAGDVDAVANAYGATRAVGTSLGAGAIAHLIGDHPDRFERLVFLLPAALDDPVVPDATSLRTAELLETLPKDEAIERALESSVDPQQVPGLRDFDVLLWQDMNPVGVARAIRGLVGERAIADRKLLGRVAAPALVICVGGDRIHPVEVGRAMVDSLPNAELLEFASQNELFGSIPELVERVSRFLS